MNTTPTYDILDAGPRNRFMVSGRIVHNCTGDGPQPTNFPKAGPNVWRCQCGRHYGESRPGCPWCGAGPEARVDHKGGPAASPSEWSPEAMNDAITVMRTGDLNTLELFFGEALLTIAGCLRGTFIAAPGHDLVSSDWTAIEAVVLACLAGEQWRIDLFREGGKIYEASGAKVGGVEYESLLEHKKRTGQHHPLRQVGKTCELALGYQGWVGAWRAFDPNGVQTDDELKQIILAWRKASPAVVEFWGGQSRRHGYETVEEYFGVEGAFIQAILNPGKVFDCRGLKFQMEGGAVYLTLLSGRRIAYHNAQLHQSDKPGSRYAISYWGWNTNPKNGPRGWIQIRTWGGRLCIAEGTPVLTLDGWKPIEDITALDSVWDGVEWVSCDGAICNGEKETIEAYGAWMTPDHQVLTTEGWRDGEEKGLQRADARIPDGYWPEGDQRQAGALGIQVRLRGGEDNRGPRHSEDDNPQRQGILRVHEAEDYFREADRPRDEPPSGVCCVGVDEGPMPPPNARSVAAIRRARDNGLPALAGELREFLGGHGADISARVGDRPQGQQRRVLPGELPMGGFTDAEREPPRQRSVGWADGGGDCPADGPTKVDGVLPHEGGGDAGANAGETKRRQKVYDVMNCGPRNRFTIWAGGDGLIVHNCENIVQATSNDLLRFASVNLERAGYPIVLHVYDEIVAEVPQGRGSIEELEAWMRYTPDWATCADGQKWPVGAAGGWRADRYRKG